MQTYIFKIMKKTLLIAGLFVLAGCSNADATPDAAKEEITESKITKQLVNVNATPETKKVYSILYNLYGKKIISGTVANIDWNYRDAENVKKWTGKYPAINVFDFINIHASKSQRLARLFGHDTRQRMVGCRRTRRMYVALAGKGKQRH